MKEGAQVIGSRPDIAGVVVAASEDRGGHRYSRVASDD